MGNFGAANAGTVGEFTNGGSRNTSRGSGIFWHNGQVLDPHGPSLHVMILSLEVRSTARPTGA